jgi:hypothetical protein
MNSLKGYWKRTKGMSHRFNNFLWEIRYALERAWKGYDCTDVFNMDCNLRDRFVVLLKEFDKTRHTSFSGIDFTKSLLNDFDKKDDETSVIVNKMIYLAEHSCWDDFIDEMDENSVDESFEIVKEKAQNNLNELCDMLKIYFWQLWD